MKTLFAVMLLSCVSFAQDDATIAKTKTACGPDDARFDVKTGNANPAPAVPDDGKALVYVISLVSQGDPCNGCSTVTRVGVDGGWAGATRGNSYLVLNVSPGEHHLCMSPQSRFASVRKYTALANFTAEAGKTYYFRTRYINTQLQAFMDLDPVNTDQGQYLVATSSMSEAHPKKP